MLLTGIDFFCFITVPILYCCVRKKKLKIIQRRCENGAKICTLTLDRTGKTRDMLFKAYLNVHVTSYRANKGLLMKTSARVCSSAT